ncbi:hypothetical protein C8J57DRAFT_432903 [Mycena rebaudengoi]|nr:hypothetical protein C8J57DRAFT_432903 [Mycena rebaudengoi]
MELSGLTLPSELERAVFEAAALLDHENIPKLLLVAHRVHTWLKPFLYRVLVYHDWDEALHRMPPIESTVLIEKHLRHLAIHATPSTSPDLRTILASCTGVQNLACYSKLDPSYMPFFEPMRPRRLVFNAAGLFSGTPDFSHPMFGNITHLGLMDDTFSSFNEDSWKQLSALPCLTHISFDCDMEDIPAEALRMILHQTTHLQALILILVRGVYSEEVWDTDLTDDPRFVVTEWAEGAEYVEDFVCGAWGGADIWVRVDNFIRLKLRGDIPKDYCYLGNGEYVYVVEV